MPTLSVDVGVDVAVDIAVDVAMTCCVHQAAVTSLHCSSATHAFCLLAKMINCGLGVPSLRHGIGLPQFRLPRLLKLIHVLLLFGAA